MFLLYARARLLLMRSMMLVAACLCPVGSAAAQAAGDTVRARLRDSEAWMSGRFVHFDSVLVMDQSGQRLQLPREDLVQLQVRRRRSPLTFLVIGAGVALAGYQAARLIAGPDSDWACDGCGITWHEGRDYLVFGAAGLALGAAVYFSVPPRWKSVFSN